MSASQSPSGGPSTETAHETTPLLASSGENRARTNETTEAEEAQHGNVNPGGESAEEGSRARRPALAGITKTLYQLFVAATVTSTCQIVSAIALWTLQVYGNNEFGQWDYAVQGTFGAVWLAVSIIALSGYLCNEYIIGLLNTDVASIPVARRPPRRDHQSLLISPLRPTHLPLHQHHRLWPRSLVCRCGRLERHHRKTRRVPRAKLLGE